MTLCLEQEASPWLENWLIAWCWLRTRGGFGSQWIWTHQWASFSTRNMAPQGAAALRTFQTILPGVLPIRMHVNNKLRKCSFVGSFLSFTYWPQIRLSPEFNLWPGGWLPFAISQVMGANLSLTSATTIGIFQSKRLLESRRVLPFLPPAGTKKPGLGNPSGWSVLPKWLPGRIALLWVRWFH